MVKTSKLPEDNVRAVGRVVVNFQYLEFTIVQLIWIMTGPDENIGQRITAGVPFTKLCELLSSIFHYHIKDSSVVEKFEHLMTQARNVNTDRNRIVHSWWFTDLDGGAPSRLKPKAKGAQYDSENIDADAVSTSISKLASDFEKFIDELYQANLIRRKPGISLDSLR
ncbi:MAG: hypothetical protein EPO61_06750 [Nitrospirae bacterium]|nr:MAG: hypothetical protein EPO61_06750 [Nitrospirota bacterium]